MNWKELIKETLGKYYRPILGADILIQTKLNLSIQIPDDRNSVLGLHSDCNSGDSPFQINLWIPITDSESSNSMFILSKKTSLEYLPILFSKQKNFTQDKEPIPEEKDFITAKKGDLILFNPLLLHGNVKNKTNSTRISINVRLKSIFSPDGDSPDRRAGTYHEVLESSIHTQTAIEYLNMVKRFN